MLLTGALPSQVQGWGLALRGGGRLQHQGLEPSGVWARGPSSLGTGLVFLAFLSLQVKKPAQGGGVQKTHQQQKKKTRSNKCQPEGKRPKKKKEKKEKIGGKRFEKPGHSLTHRKNSIALGDRSQASPVQQGTAGAASAGMGQSTEHPSSEVLGPGELGTCPNGSFSKKGNEDEGKAGEGAAEPPPAAVLAGLTGHGCVLCPPCGHSIPPRST